MHLLRIELFYFDDNFSHIAQWVSLLMCALVNVSIANSKSLGLPNSFHSF